MTKETFSFAACVSASFEKLYSSVTYTIPLPKHWQISPFINTFRSPSRPKNSSSDPKNLNLTNHLPPQGYTINQILVRKICNFSAAIHVEINIFPNLYHPMESRCR